MEISLLSRTSEFLHQHEVSCQRPVWWWWEVWILKNTLWYYSECFIATNKGSSTSCSAHCRRMPILFSSCLLLFWTILIHIKYIPLGGEVKRGSGFLEHYLFLKTVCNVRDVSTITYSAYTIDFWRKKKRNTCFCICHCNCGFFTCSR